MNKEKVAEHIAIFYLRYNRGKGLFGFVNDIFQYSIYAGAGIVMWNRFSDSFKIPIEIVPYTALAFIVLYFVGGFIDERIGFWKVENAMNARRYNPFFAKMEQDIEEIKNKLNK